MTLARFRPKAGKGSSEDDAYSAYPIPGTNVQVGPDPGQRGTGSAPIPLGLQPPQQVFLSPQTGSDAQINDGPPIENGENPVGTVDEFLDAAKMQRDLLDHIDAGSRRIYEAITHQGEAVIRLDGSAGAVNPGQVGISHLRFRVRAIVFTRLTAGVTNLIIGSARYPFNLPGVPTTVDTFPLVIERGSDVQIDGDGFAYLIGIPE